MARPLVLLLYVSAHLLKDCHSLRWEEGLESGARIVQCSGQQVTFPWRYTLEEGDKLVGISWTHRAAEGEKETNLGNFAFGIFDTTNDRISQMGEAGMNLSDIRHADSGTYTVYVRLSGHGGVASQNASLLVAEPPKTSKGWLEVLVNDLPASVTTQSQVSAVNGDGSDRLMCGQFTNLGTPPASVVWEDPDGHILPSTKFEQGYFILDLSQQSKGGNYHCLLNRSSTAVKCLPVNSPLHEKAVVGVLKRAAPSAEASMSGGLVAAIIIVILVLIAVVVIVLIVIVVRRRKGKSYAPKEPDSPGPEDEPMQPGSGEEPSQPFKVL